MLEIIQNKPEITREIYTISQLNQATKLVLETNFSLLWVSGEISNFSQPSSGHMYFSLKDETAQVRCAMFRFRNGLLNFMPKNGMQILARAKVSLYEGRGEYQLLIEHMEEAGDGLLRRAFELLKQKLAAQGLFNPQHKKTLPSFANTVGIITSPTGAAIQDIISVLKRRMPCLKLIIYPSAVQGNEAASQLTTAIKLANQRQECEVIILGRGGGSLEDLWPFNEESVAQAIFNSQIPIISAVGHEVDYTIADFVADQRAPTPSAAAELISFNQIDLLRQLHQQYQNLSQRFLRFLQQQQQQINWLAKRIQHPKQRLQTRAQQLDYLEQRLLSIQNQWLRYKQNELKQLTIKLQAHTPQNRLKILHTQCTALAPKLQRAIDLLLQQRLNQLAQLSGTLNMLSPLATLERGYAIVYKDEQLVKDAKQLQIGDKIANQLARGTIYATVDTIKTTEQTE